MQIKVLNPCLLTLGACCIRSTSICEFKFGQQMSSGANDHAQILQFAAFRDHGGGNVAGYPT